jgi:hypothetical protein
VKLFQTRVLIVILASASALLSQDDAREVIRRAVAADLRNWKTARDYTFSERVDSRYMDSQGRLKSREVRSHDVLLLDASPYRRLVARDDRPLLPADEKKEQEQFNRNVTARRQETVVQRTLRVTEYARRPDWQREAWRELPEAFDFRFVAEENLDGHRLYVIEAVPRHGYEPGTRTGKILARLKAKLWVDRQDYRVVKVEADVMETISVGLFLVRVAKGSHATLEQIPVNQGVWLPHRVHAILSARVGLVKMLRIDQEIIYSNFREVHADLPAILQ